jgi:uroporphyrinogen III methyltransferase/synthase
MGVTRLKRIAQVLIEHGMPENKPVALVRNGSWPDQLVKTTTLIEVATSGESRLIEPPALIVIGEVVNARKAIDWWSRLPLAGKTVLVTRPENEAQNTVSALEDLGARVLVAPAITIRPIDDPSSLDQTLLRLNSFDWLVFTSANGVRFFIRRIFQTGFDIRQLGHIKIAAIGPGTAKALEEFGIKADLIPQKYRSEDLANALAEHVKGKKVLLARADRGRTVLKDELDPIADEVVQVPVYHNADADSIPEEVLQEIRNNQVDWVLLTSSAIARRFAAMLPPDEAQNLIAKIKFASISPVTSDATRAVGIEPIVEAEVFTLAGLIDAIIEFK